MSGPNSRPIESRSLAAPGNSRSSRCNSTALRRNKSRRPASTGSLRIASIQPLGLLGFSSVPAQIPHEPKYLINIHYVWLAAKSATDFHSNGAPFLFGVRDLGALTTEDRSFGISKPPSQRCHVGTEEVHLLPYASSIPFHSSNTTAANGETRFRLMSSVTIRLPAPFDIAWSSLARSCPSALATWSIKGIRTTFWSQQQVPALRIGQVRNERTTNVVPGAVRGSRRS